MAWLCVCRRCPEADSLQCQRRCQPLGQRSGQTRAGVRARKEKTYSGRMNSWHFVQRCGLAQEVTHSTDEFCLCAALPLGHSTGARDAQFLAAATILIQQEAAHFARRIPSQLRELGQPCRGFSFYSRVAWPSELRATPNFVKGRRGARVSIRCVPEECNFGSLTRFLGGGFISFISWVHKRFAWFGRLFSKAAASSPPPSPQAQQSPCPCSG